ncbi:uncharacterized protein MYCFIDRAFT_212444 [Pseudocercospora fijiensis CIRAD86]|uniref:Uncharacterized protein n=1 Tax=Pseudocercospora fijiensis (strain CIRAD86) TaxID=383855 RepID=M3A2N3_PSEFD|nr:uncharacterized protein MYCFIDRAFT_212444 [Pseudocercospora fijiensis CIRAD86]EME78656.1 hypothetical protein MYCFIDRAFT_212444 [Pseudocercospora fijiensis CIRAD86]
MGQSGTCRWVLHCPRVAPTRRYLILACHKCRPFTTFPLILKKFVDRMTTPYGPSMSPIFYSNFKLGGWIHCRTPQQLDGVVSRVTPCTLARLPGLVPA